jgi:hypothetical protein
LTALGSYKYALTFWVKLQADLPDSTSNNPNPNKAYVLAHATALE